MGFPSYVVSGDPSAAVVGAAAAVGATPAGYYTTVPNMLDPYAFMQANYMVLGRGGVILLSILSFLLVFVILILCDICVY